jgi:hypothetical protein
LLPEIHSSSEIYGYITEGPLKGIPISAVSIHYSVESCLYQRLKISSYFYSIEGCQCNLLFLYAVTQRQLLQSHSYVLDSR